MPVTPAAPPAARSVTATARRAQIVAATVEVLAEVGYRQTSFARIRAHAGLSSTRLISYHFAGKGELIAAVTEHVIGDIGAALHARVSRQPDAPARLRAYVEGTVEYVGTHRAAMTALLEIALGGGLPPGAADPGRTVGPIEAILRQGQADGSFRAFDTAVMAATVQRSLEALPFLLRADPGLDTAHYARELVTLFDLATRAETR